ncbi:MAG: helicase-related protein, partial [Candidatus Omnitrophota bacterium]
MFNHSSSVDSRSIFCHFSCINNSSNFIISTSTLELGIDVGSVRSVAQIGAPHSVSGLRQRLGRSGRRDDDPSILRIYISEKEIKKDTAVSDKLRFELVQGISLIQLLVQKWCEPSRDEACHFSTLIQQILSVIAERGGITAEKLYYVLCKKGAFSNVASNSFV